MPKSRRELQQEFQAELYLSASFFKMKSLGSRELDRQANLAANSYGVRTSLPHPRQETRYIPEREKWSKLKQIVRDPEQIEKLNKSSK